MGKNQAPDRDEQPNHVSESLNSLMRIRDPEWKKLDLGSGMEKFGSGIRDGKIRIRDPGWKNSDPG